MTDLHIESRDVTAAQNLLDSAVFLRNTIAMPFVSCQNSSALKILLLVYLVSAALVVSSFGSLRNVECTNSIIDLSLFVHLKGPARVLNVARHFMNAFHQLWFRNDKLCG